MKNDLQVPGKGFLSAVFLISAAILSFETLLPREFAVYSAGNLTFFCISLALLGLASGGIAVSVWEDFFMKNFHKKLAYCSLAFGFSLIGSTWMTTKIGGFFNAVIDQRYANIITHQATASYDALTLASLLPNIGFVFFAGIANAVPFLFGGICISLAIKAYSKWVGRVYGVDLLGAALGGVLSVLGLTYLSISTTLIGLACLISFAAFFFLFSNDESKSQKLKMGIIFSFVFFIFLFFQSVKKYELFNFSVHRYAFGRSLIEGPLNEIRFHWTPLGRIGLFEKDWSPPHNLKPRLRHKIFVGMDLGGHSIVEKFSPKSLERIKYSSKYSDDIIEPTVLPGMFSNPKKYLILMAGNGQEMLRTYAWYGDQIQIDGVEINPWVYRLGLEYLPDHLKGFFKKPNITMHIADGRNFVEASKEHYDVIILSHSGASFATGTGSFASTPQFLFTQEAFVSYLEKLSDQGLIISPDSSRSVALFRLFAAALAKVDPSAIPEKNIVAYHTPADQRDLLFLHRKALSRKKVAAIDKVLRAHGLEMTCSWFTDCSSSQLAGFMKERKIEIQKKTFQGPGTFKKISTPFNDNHPFFYFVGRTTKSKVAILALSGTLLIAGFLSLLFLFTPVLLMKKKPSEAARPTWKSYYSFALLGAGFMSLEIGMLQRLELFMGYPTLTLVVILLSLLIGTGIGSFFSEKIFKKRSFSPSGMCLSICTYSLLLLFFLNRGMYPLMTFPLSLRILFISIFLLPYGALLGTLFPFFISRLHGQGAARFVAWAWAINGVFSVLSSNFSALVYIMLGSNAVLFLGIACYGLLGIIDRLVVSSQR